MNFCSHCGAPVSLQIPPGDNLPRHICEACGTIHYQNPKVVVGAIATWEDKILMCRRAIEPRYGMWTLPAGFMENNETSGEAALRETLEEAVAHVVPGGVGGLEDAGDVHPVDEVPVLGGHLLEAGVALARSRARIGSGVGAGRDMTEI